MLDKIKNVLVTGGAGFVGSALVPELLQKGYSVKVIDWYLYGEWALDGVRGHEALREIKGDIRDEELLKKELKGVDAVIHLASISNDPSFDLNPGLGRAVNHLAMRRLVDISKDLGVRRFIYASSSSVYGLKKEAEVTENLALEPLTEYSKTKALGEEYLMKRAGAGFTALVLRPATVCGYAPRLRLDLVLNVFTNQAFHKKKITLFGGGQKRPNIHIQDMTDAYVRALEWPKEKIAGRVFNVGAQNRTLKEIAEAVQRVVGGVEIESIPTDDERSYHISSEKIRAELGFVPTRSLEQAVADLVNAFQAGLVRDPLNNPRYYNVKMMQDFEPSVTVAS